MQSLRVLPVVQDGIGCQRSGKGCDSSWLLCPEMYLLSSSGFMTAWKAIHPDAASSKCNVRVWKHLFAGAVYYSYTLMSATQHASALYSYDSQSIRALVRTVAKNIG